MKKKFEEFFERFDRWNGFLKLPILLIMLGVCALILLQSASISLSAFSASTPLQVYYFDVGQASSSLVITPSGSSVLIDTGDSDTSSELVASVREILLKNGLSNLSVLVLSHSDADHVGGASAILDAFDPVTIYRPLIASLDEQDLVTETGCYMSTTQTYQVAIEAVWAEGCKVVYHSDSEISFDSQTSMKIFAPQKTYYSDTNSYSPYILLQYQDVNFLFTGDATQTREAELLETLESTGTSLKVDVLEVPHHGSKYSSSAEFLSALSPTYAVVSAGDSTHPSSEVLERLEAVGVEDVLVTKEIGTICVGVTENGEIVFESSTESLDYPLILVSICLLTFMIFHLIDENETRKNSEIFLFRRKKIEKNKF